MCVLKICGWCSSVVFLRVQVDDYVSDIPPLYSDLLTRTDSARQTRPPPNSNKFEFPPPVSKSPPWTFPNGTVTYRTHRTGTGTNTGTGTDFRTVEEMFITSLQFPELVGPGESIFLSFRSVVFRYSAVALPNLLPLEVLCKYSKK